MPSTLVYVLLWMCLAMGSVCASPPQFTGIPNVVQISESYPIGSTLCTFTVTDPNPNHTVHLTATPSELIKLSVSSGTPTLVVSVILMSALDREVAFSHTLRFVATDDDLNEVVKTLPMYVEKGKPPSFENIPYAWSIPEIPFDPLAAYKRIRATDPVDGLNRTVKYSIDPNGESDYLQTFGINANTGQVTLKKSLDYAENSFYRFTLYATDDGAKKFTSYVPFNIRVEDVQNRPPFFMGLPYRTSVNEKVPSNTKVVKVTALDGDAEVFNIVNYTISGGSCKDSFTIDSNNGQISTSKQLDRDSGSISDVYGVCRLTILVVEIDGGHPQYGDTSSSTEVTIIVNDINDNFPTFNSMLFRTRIHENAPRYAPIVLVDQQQIHVFDNDQGDNAIIDITVEWTNGSKCEQFKVLSDVVHGNGPLVVQVNEPNNLDFEVTKILEFQIVARERANAHHMAKATVSLVITDVNDNSPQFDEQLYVFNLPLTTRADFYVGIIRATDVDSGSFGKVIYSIFGTDKFKVNPLTGEIRTVFVPGEMGTGMFGIYYFTAVATDEEGQGRSNSTRAVVEMVCANGPLASSSPSSTTNPEGIQVGMEITQGSQRLQDVLQTIILALAAVILGLTIVIATFVFLLWKNMKRFRTNCNPNEEKRKGTRNNPNFNGDVVQREERADVPTTDSNYYMELIG